MRSNIRIPLPKGWPRTIRSAVIHAISLAQFSLTHSRSWAANNWNARFAELPQTKVPPFEYEQEYYRIQEDAAIVVGLN